MLRGLSLKSHRRAFGKEVGVRDLQSVSRWFIGEKRNVPSTEDMIENLVG